MKLSTLSLLLLLTAASSFSPSKEQDAVADEAEEAAWYARYMAATEASAPLVRSAPSARRRSSAASGLRRVVTIHGAAGWDRRYPLGRHMVYAWTPWSLWSPCSRSCATGVTSRHRTCHQQSARITAGSGIRSSYQQCTGESSEFSVCNQQNCPSAAPVQHQSYYDHFRQIQCSFYDNRTVQGHYVSSWIPNPSESNPCELSCRPQQHAPALVYTFGKVEDGTPCSVSGHFCVNGRCLAAGCDGRIGSSVTRDMCDVCGGANNTCQRMAAVAFPTQVLLKTRNNQPSYGYSPVVRIPRGATNIRMTDNSTNYIALMDDGHGYFLNGNWIIDWPGRYQASGTSFNYQRTKDSESIASRGPLQKDVIVMVLVRERGSGVYYEYWLPRGDPQGAKQHLPASTTRSPTTYEVQPTAARLIKTPPRNSYLYHNILKPTTSTTTAIPPTSTTIGSISPSIHSQID